MGGQAIERREVMRLLALASVASTFPGFRRWTFACDHGAGQAGLARRDDDPYQPQFFSPAEYALVERLTELIIPSDGTPGAREAGVSEFIDFMVSSDPRIQARFRYGVGWIDAHARWLYGQSFLNLTADQQNDLLGHLAYKDRYRAGEADGREFFKLIRDYTVMGYFTSRIGMEQLDVPGLKAVWKEMPACPHKDDPEHLHLPPPRF